MAGWGRPQPKNTQVGSGDSGPTRLPTTTYFLRRLNRLIELNASPQLDTVHRRFVEHALYSTYWDCVHLGLRDDARRAIGISSDG